MQDESKHSDPYGSHGGMAKNKGSIPHGSLHNRPVTFLQDSASKIKILESKSDKSLRVAWSPKNHKLVFGGDKE